MDFKFEEKETYTLDEVKVIMGDFKSKIDETIAIKDETITELTTEVEKVQELTKSNHNLSINNLAIKNGISEDMIDLIYDDDLEKVSAKIEKIKSLTKEQEITNSYKPEGKRSEDSYEKAINSKDVEGALRHKLGRLFQ